jgi:indolepyruvate ferredoxin oxidoreductase, beta subunit
MTGFSVVIAGVGGQGVLSASRLLAQAAVSAGERVIVGDTFGASQREGSVMSVVRFGEDALGSLVSPGGADMLISFEPYEALRRLHLLREGGTVLVDAAAVLPAQATLHGGYPPLDQVWFALERKAGKFIRLNASSLATELAERHKSSYDVTNVVILGAAVALSGFPVEEAALISTMEQRFNQKSLALNKEALASGRRLGLQGGGA